MRPGLSKCLATLKKGDVLVIWRLDRLGRTMRRLLEIKDLLDQLGVELKSLSETLDTTTASGKFMFHMLCAIAQQERDTLIERTNAGLQAAKSRGSKPGRRPSLTTDQIREAKKLLKTKSRKYVAEYFKVSPTTIRRLVVNGGLGSQ